MFCAVMHEYVEANVCARYKGLPRATQPRVFSFLFFAPVFLQLLIGYIESVFFAFLADPSTLSVRISMCTRPNFPHFAKTFA